MTEEEIKARIEAISKDFVNSVEASGEKWEVREAILAVFANWIRGMVSLQEQNAALRAKIVALGGEPSLP
jgi:hypothetical protein